MALLLCYVQMNCDSLKKTLRHTAICVLSLFSLILTWLLMNHVEFSAWAFNRHQNPLSWYIRPLFLIPFCFAAWCRSYLGIWLTLFLLLTSMFWFPPPAEIDSRIQAFLLMERHYLIGRHSAIEILWLLTVPLALFALATAFWQRSPRLGLMLLILIAAIKIIWSLLYGNDSGKSIIFPAAFGLLICMLIVGKFLAVKRSVYQRK